MARRRGPTKAASRKGGKKAARASRACKGKTGRAFHNCRTRWFASHRKK